MRCRSDSFYCHPFDNGDYGGASTMQPYFTNLVGRLPPQMTGMYKRPDADAWWVISQTGGVFEVKQTPQYQQCIALSAVICTSCDLFPTDLLEQ